MGDHPNSCGIVQSGGGFVEKSDLERGGPNPDSQNQMRFFTLCRPPPWSSSSPSAFPLSPSERIHFSIAGARAAKPATSFFACAPIAIKMSASLATPASVSLPETKSNASLSHLAPLEAILFDIDGTLCDSDPLHYHAFREMLQEVGFNNGMPITEDDFSKLISGRHNDDIARSLFPDWDHEKAMKFMDDKEAMFRRLAAQQLQALPGLQKLCKWVEDHGLKRAAVTNAPRANAELMISILGLTDFFQFFVVGSECDRAKPFPDPYLKALELLNASVSHTMVFEDSESGIKAGVAAGIPVVGLATRNPEQLLMDAGATFLVKDYEDDRLWNNLQEILETKEGLGPHT